MAENKVVIKINYDKDNSRKPMSESKTITVWHTDRIVAALIILILLIALPIFWLSGDDEKDSGEIQKLEIVDKAQPLNNNDHEIKAAGIPVNEARPVRQESAIGVQNTKNDKDIKNVAKRPAAIIFSRKVIRASLNSGPKDSEPYQPVKLPIRLAQNQSIDVFYFTELKEITDRNLYHTWSKNGHVIEKKQLSIKDRRSKVLSSRTLSFKDKGEWQIQLVDNKGKVFSEFNFSVNPE